MPKNSADYQRRYREKNIVKQSFVTVSMSPKQRAEIRSFAGSQGFSASRLMREASLHQIRGTQLRSRNIEEELQQLRIAVSSIGNNLNQLAKHSNRIKDVVDEPTVLSLFADFHTLAQKLADTRLNEKIGYQSQGAEKLEAFGSSSDTWTLKNQTTIMTYTTTVLREVKKILPMNLTKTASSGASARTETSSTMRS